MTSTGMTSTGMTSTGTTGAAPSHTAGVAPETAAGIASTNRRFEETFRSGGAAAAAREVYTRDARVMPPGAPTVLGRDAAEQFWPAAQQALGIVDVQLSTVELEPLGDAAYEVGSARLTLAGGQQVTAKYVVIWRQEDGRWRWHVDIWNMDA